MLQILEKQSISLYGAQESLKNLVSSLKNLKNLDPLKQSVQMSYSSIWK